MAGCAIKTGKRINKYGTLYRWEITKSNYTGNKIPEEQEEGHRREEDIAVCPAGCSRRHGLASTKIEDLICCPGACENKKVRVRRSRVLREVAEQMMGRPHKRVPVRVLSIFPDLQWANQSKVVTRKVLYLLGTLWKESKRNATVRKLTHNVVTTGVTTNVLQGLVGPS